VTWWLASLIGDAHAHEGAVPVRGVYDWSDLPDAEPGVWLQWDLFPSIVIGCLLFSLGYEWLAGPGRRRLGLSPVGPTLGDRVRFHLGVFVVFASLQGPLHELSDVYLFSGHMVQHLLITLVFPPLALSGIPSWMWRVVTDRPALLRIGQVLGRPAAGFVVSTAVLYLWHVPTMYDLALYDHTWHVVEHLSFMTAYVVMWFPAMSRAEALPPLTPGRRMIYLFLLTIPMKALGAIITVSDWVLYSFYVDKPRVFGLDPLVDQRLGGLIMWLPGGLVFWVSIGYVFFTHYRSEIVRGRQGGGEASDGSHDGPGQVVPFPGPREVA